MGDGAAGERRQHGEDQQRQRERAEAIAAALWSSGRVCRRSQVRRSAARRIGC